MSSPPLSVEEVESFSGPLNPDFDDQIIQGLFPSGIKSKRCFKIEKGSIFPLSYRKYPSIVPFIAYETNSNHYFFILGGQYINSLNGVLQFVRGRELKKWMVWNFI